MYNQIPKDMDLGPCCISLQKYVFCILYIQYDGW